MERLKNSIRKMLGEKSMKKIRLLRTPYLIHRNYEERIGIYVNLEDQSFTKDIEYYLSILRMNAHVLDKGLNRDDWEPNHSYSVYKKVKELLANVGDLNDDSVTWANEIVCEYESRQTMARKESASREIREPLISGDTVLKFLQERTSSRAYRAERVSLQVVEKITEAALESPWSCSRQALRVYGSVDPAMALKVLSHFPGFTCFGRFVPCALVFCVDLRPYGMPSEIFVPHLDTGLAVENACLMASAIGLSTTLLSWGARLPKDEAGLRQFFEIPNYFEIVVGCACGYPARYPVRPPRKAVSKTLFLK